MLNEACIRERCLHGAISTQQLTEQVTGSANVMVTVATTKELLAGDNLLRYKAQGIEDDIPGMSFMSIRSMLNFERFC